jgi:plasmid maintenance system antidote protein VapI
MAKLKPVHPGEILREEFMGPLKLNPHRLALALRVPAPEFRMNLQTHYDLEVARDKEQRKVDEEVRPIAINA